MKQVRRQTFKFLAAECHVGIGATAFLNHSVCGLIVWLLACGEVQLAVCFEQTSLTQFLDLGWWVKHLSSWEEPLFSRGTESVLGVGNKAGSPFWFRPCTPEQPGSDKKASLWTLWWV